MPRGKAKKVESDSEDSAPSENEEVMETADNVSDDEDNEKKDSNDASDEGNDSDDEKPKKRRSSRAKKPVVSKAKAAPSKGTKRKSSSTEKDDETETKVTKKARSSPKAPVKIKTEKKGLVKVKLEPESSNDSKASKKKTLSKLDRLEEARKAYKWWEAPELPDGINWYTLEHAGIKFAPPYVRHNINLLYDGKPVHLNDEQEEIATFYAAIPEDGPQLGNPVTRPVFQKNFFEDFQQVLEPGHPIKSFEKCDFSLIRNYLEVQKSLKKASTDKEKADRKNEKEAIQLQFGYALIDGRMEKMGNFNMEPPGLFRGRGEHPLTGHLKKRCFSESVGINLSEDTCIPKVELPGHAWKSVQHDSGVTWLCNWQENVQDQTKYVMLAASSSFKGKSDMDKYQTAIRLKSHIDQVRRDYTQKIRSKDNHERQLGVAMWVIDVLALRCGGEKGEDEADTVGCCSLRCEHLKFSAENDLELELEFLGKDSMLFKQTIEFTRYKELGKEVFACLKTFVSGKSEGDDLFDTLTPTILNKHLNSIMKGLTAKVFRTFNASVTLEKELPTSESLEKLSLAEKVLRYNAANREVAILCNHQKTVSKASEAAFEKLNARFDTLRKQKEDLIKWKKILKTKPGDIPLKDDDDDSMEKAKKALEKANLMKEHSTSKEEKLQAAAAVEAAKAQMQDAKLNQFSDKHKFKSLPTAAQLDSRIEKWTEDLKKMEVDLQNKDDNKEVSLGTSKINYMDPRITVAWCKRCEVPIEKVFPKTLRDKFNWAMAVSPEWKFE